MNTCLTPFPLTRCLSPRPSRWRQSRWCWGPRGLLPSPDPLGHTVPQRLLGNAGPHTLQGRHLGRKGAEGLRGNGSLVSSSAGPSQVAAAPTTRGRMSHWMRDQLLLPQRGNGLEVCVSAFHLLPAPLAFVLPHSNCPSLHSPGQCQHISFRLSLYFPGNPV